MSTVALSGSPRSATAGRFVANLVTSFLVLGASKFGVPVSTTHVSCGALFGIGASSGGGHARIIFNILGAWLITLPIGIAGAVIIYYLTTIFLTN